MITNYTKHTGNVNSKGYGMKRLSKRLQNLSQGDVILDKAFQPYANGITKYSLLVWEQIKKHVNVKGFTVAKMSYSRKDHYTLTLTHIDGFKVVLKGCSAGYSGEGSRGSHKVLTEAGFSNPDRVFKRENETFTFKRVTV